MISAETNNREDPVQNHLELDISPTGCPSSSQPPADISLVALRRPADHDVQHLVGVDHFVQLVCIPAGAVDLNDKIADGDLLHLVLLDIVVQLHEALLQLFDLQARAFEMCLSSNSVQADLVRAIALRDRHSEVPTLEVRARCHRGLLGRLLCRCLVLDLRLNFRRWRFGSCWSRLHSRLWGTLRKWHEFRILGQAETESTLWLSDDNVILRCFVAASHALEHRGNVGDTPIGRP
mmetsp:Transcript_50767/g.164175  ORF Transcript_50767/g.164175 Transcript_50767/m.164175 type:complete len:235 (-) Transcript_50767:151-855(-)